MADHLFPVSHIWSKTMTRTRFMFSSSRGFCWCFMLEGRPSQNALHQPTSPFHTSTSGLSHSQTHLHGLPYLSHTEGVSLTWNLHLCLSACAVCIQGKPAKNRSPCTASHSLTLLYCCSTAVTSQLYHWINIDTGGWLASSSWLSCPFCLWWLQKESHGLQLQ